jgi:hypothetical protein
MICTQKGFSLRPFCCKSSLLAALVNDSQHSFGVSHLAYLAVWVSGHLPPFAKWTAFPSSDCRVGGGAPHGANLRPPLKLHVQFSRMQLSRRRARAGRKGRSKLDPVPQHPTWSPKEWTFLAAVGLSQSASLLDRECTGLSPWNCSSFSTLLFWFAFPSRPSDAGRLPRPIPVADWLGHAAFTALVVPLQPSDYWPSIARHFARGLIGSLTAGQPADSASPPEVTGNSSVPCRPHTPWYGG